MERNYKMMVWDGRRYNTPSEFADFTAKGPMDALKKTGLDETGLITYSRKGYGYFTGRIEVRAIETVAAANGRTPLPADFLILAIN